MAKRDVPARVSFAARDIIDGYPEIERNSRNCIFFD